MILRQLKYFVSVVRLGSFTEAAEECYISQSAISQQIQTLESEIGVQLIIRAGRSFSLTAAGEYLYRQAILLLDEAERIKNETVRIGGKGCRSIRIGYLSGYTGNELGSAIADFSVLFPDIDISTVSGNHEELRVMSISKEVDLSLNDQRRAFSDEFFNFHLYTCLCYAEVSVRSPLAALSKVTAEELKRIPCILISSREQQSNEIDFYKNYLGFSGSFLFASSLEEARLMVSANKGFLPVQITKNSGVPDGAALGRIPLYQNEKQVERAYYAFWPKDHTSPEVEKFVEILHSKF